jgi:hypothetical protein
MEIVRHFWTVRWTCISIEWARGPVRCFGPKCTQTSDMDQTPSIIRLYRVWLPGLRWRLGKLASCPHDPTKIVQPDPSTGARILRAESLMESLTPQDMTLRAARAHLRCRTCQLLRGYSSDCIYDVMKPRQIAVLKDRALSAAAQAIVDTITQESMTTAFWPCAVLAQCRGPPHTFHDTDFHSRSTVTALSLHQLETCRRHITKHPTCILFVLSERAASTRHHAATTPLCWYEHALLVQTCGAHSKVIRRI